jgi:hypothetical protein
MTHPIFWLESEDFAPDVEAEAAAENSVDSEEETDYWSNMVYPI